MGRAASSLFAQVTRTAPQKQEKQEEEEPLTFLLFFFREVGEEAM